MMNTVSNYRCFKTSVTGGHFVITEQAPRHDHPMNWSSAIHGSSRDGAWFLAQSQTLPVVVIDRDGTQKALGRVWSPKAFEMAAYKGYISYGLSMNDGYYAPEAFEAWVKGFRKTPAEYLERENDASDEVKHGLPFYLEALASLSR